MIAFALRMMSLQTTVFGKLMESDFAENILRELIANQQKKRGFAELEDSSDSEVPTICSSVPTFFR